MRGEILSYDETAGSGLISGDDLARYAYDRADLGGDVAPAPGLRVDFVPDGGQARQIILLQVQERGLPAAAFQPGEPPLDMWAYFVRCLRGKYFDGYGRARRLEYWSFVLFSTLTMIGAFLPFLFAAAVLGAVSEDLFPLSLILLILPVLWTFYMVIPSACVAIRRLHDIGLTGWLYLVAFIPYVGGFFMLVVACIPSQPYPNPYGPPQSRS